MVVVLTFTFGVSTAWRGLGKARVTMSMVNHFTHCIISSFQLYLMSQFAHDYHSSFAEQHLESAVLGKGRYSSDLQAMLARFARALHVIPMENVMHQHL